MKKRYLSALAALLMLLSMFAGGAAEEEFDWSAAYDAYYLEYDAGGLPGWEQTVYADREGMLLYMHGDETEVSVSLQERSMYPTLENLAETQLEYVKSYGSITRDAVQKDWYAPWDDSQPGIRMEYSYTFGRSEADAVYDVVKYMAVFNDDKYLMIEVTDRSGDSAATVAKLEKGFLRSLSVGSFTVTGGSSAFLTGAQEMDGEVWLTLQPYEVALSEDGAGYSVNLTGDTQTMQLSPEARIMAPTDQNTGMLENIALTVRDINDFIDEYRSSNGDDCVFNLLHSNGVIRWMTYSYLY